MDLLLKGAVLVDPAGGWDGAAEILIKGDKVEAVAVSLGAVDVPCLDLTGKTIIPGLIDMHVHLREPGGERKETIATGCAAAVAGGITSLASMPNTLPSVDNKVVVAFVKERARRAALARVYPIGALTRGQEGRVLAPMLEMAKEGAVAFSDDGRPVTDSSVMLRAMQTVFPLDLPVISHCEELSLSTGGVVHAGRVGYRMGVPVISANSEAIMVAREILLQQEVGGKVHLAHLSTRQSVDLLKTAKERGATGISAEVTPHHLLLTEEAVENFDADAKMNPPLRTADDRNSLLEALQKGYIDCIATDHAPHRPEEKEDFINAPFGVVGLETALPLLWTRLVEKGLLTPAGLVTAFSTAPARILNIPGGTLVPGSPADLCVFDPRHEFVVETNNFFSLGKNTPFKGWRLKGLPFLTMVGGDIKMWKGRVKGFSADFTPELGKSLLS